MKKLTILLTTAILTLSVQANSHPNWCKSHKKLSYTEQSICSSNILSSADALLNHLYTDVMKFQGKEGQEGMWAAEVKDNQLYWMKNRNKLNSENEILKSYMGRINNLYGTLKEKQHRSVSVVYDNIKDIYHAVVDNKAERLASLIDFPITIVINGKDRHFKHKQAFLEAYPKIFTKKYREIVASAKPTKKAMMENYQGIMLGSGSIWFDEKGHVKTFNTEN